jgi:ADP-ribose 1''-phosphate phosphatase
MITYKKMSLFDVPEGSVLVHSCNALGVWGSGIAAAFHEKYPRSFDEYNKYCKRSGPVVGTSVITNQENKRFVGCLITSNSYGKDKDPIHDIIAQTYLSLHDFCKEYEKLKHAYQDSHEEAHGFPIYSNKFNSGMFKVPWNYSEIALRYFVKKYDLNWIVCDPDLR